jgi:hypothetical protein
MKSPTQVYFESFNKAEIDLKTFQCLVAKRTAETLHDHEFFQYLPMSQVLSVHVNQVLEFGTVNAETHKALNTWLLANLNAHDHNLRELDFLRWCYKTLMRHGEKDAASRIAVHAALAKGMVFEHKNFKKAAAALAKRI